MNLPGLSSISQPRSTSRFSRALAPSTRETDALSQPSTTAARRPPGTQPVIFGLPGGGHQRLVVHRQVLDTVRVLPMRHRASRSYRLPRRRPDSHHGGRFLLGQRLQILLETDRPSPEDFFGVRQVRPNALQFGLELLHSHRRGLPPRFQNRPHRWHSTPPRRLDQQRIEASVTTAIPCLTSGIRTRGSERERPLTSAEWDRLESFLPRGGVRGGRWSDHRRVINGVLYRVRTGVQWRDLPGSDRGRPSTNGIAAGRLTERGRCCCLLSRPPRTPWAESTGTCRSTQQRSGPTSTPPVQGRRLRRRLFKRGPPQGRTRSIQSCGSCASGWRRWSDRRMPGTFPRGVHHQGPSRRRRTMPAHRLHPDSRALR